MGCGRVRLIVVVCVLAAAALLHTATAEIYTVATAAWSIPSNDSVYRTWAADKRFKIGDVLVFNFTTGTHDVTEVTKENYVICGKTNPIATVTTGPAHVNLTTIGMHYYICSFGQHCAAGQKLAVEVTQPGSRSSGTSAATPPSTSTVSISPTSSTTISSPRSPSSAVSFLILCCFFVVISVTALVFVK